MVWYNRRMSFARRMIAAASVVLVVTLGMGSVSQAATPKPNTACPKVGKSVTVKGTKLVCTKSGKRVIWKEVKKVQPIAIGWVCPTLAAKGRTAQGVDVVCEKQLDGKQVWVEPKPTDSGGGNNNGSGGSGTGGSTEPTPVLGWLCSNPGATGKTAEGVAVRCTLGSDGKSAWSKGPAPGQTPIKSSAEIPQVIENWGLDLKNFDPATGFAGVMKIAGVRPPQFSNPSDTAMYSQIVSIYGDVINGKVELQMALIAPLGTNVISMIDGVVCDMPMLYSGDYSVRIAVPGTECSGNGAPFLFEHEHLISPTVKVGDVVTAGQVIGKVSDYKSAWTQLGFGIIEIGVAFNKEGSGLPWKACIANYITPAKKTELAGILTSVMKAWIAERNDPTLYDITKQNPIGCSSQDDIQG